MCVSFKSIRDVWSFSARLVSDVSSYAQWCNTNETRVIRLVWLTFTINNRKHSLCFSTSFPSSFSPARDVYACACVCALVCVFVLVCVCGVACLSTSSASYASVPAATAHSLTQLIAASAWEMVRLCQTVCIYCIYPINHHLRQMM